MFITREWSTNHSGTMLLMSEMYRFHSLYGLESGCVDVNECQERVDRCDSNAMCVNEVGGYSCQCKPGYEGNGYYCGAVVATVTDAAPTATGNISIVIYYYNHVPLELRGSDFYSTVKYFGNMR